MRRVEWRVLVGILLVAVGALLLLQTLGIFRFVWDFVWSILFLAGGVAFLVAFLGREEDWWAVIPGMALLGIGALIGLSIIGLGEIIGGAVFLGALSLSFWLVYLRRRENWWAVIPGGVLLTLAVVAGLEQVVPWAETGGLFFVGLALTFGAVYLLPTPQGRMTWALIPAAVLLVVGLVVVLATSTVLQYLWPAVLILFGGFLVLRALLRSQR
jgi:predicted permease